MRARALRRPQRAVCWVGLGSGRRTHGAACLQRATWQRAYHARALHTEGAAAAQPTAALLHTHNRPCHPLCLCQGHLCQGTHTNTRTRTHRHLHTHRPCHPLCLRQGHLCKSIHTPGLEDGGGGGALRPPAGACVSQVVTCGVAIFFLEPIHRKTDLKARLHPRGIRQCLRGCSTGQLPSLHTTINGRWEGEQFPQASPFLCIHHIPSPTFAAR